MKIFRFIKKCFFIESLFLSSLVKTIPLRTAPLNTTRLNAISLILVAMSNQPCKARQKLLMLIAITQYFTLLVLKHINVVAIVIIFMIPTQKYVFLML